MWQAQSHAQSQALKLTERWVDNWVIGKKLCPFVKPLRDNNALRIHISAARTAEEFKEEASNEIALLQQGMGDYNSNDSNDGIPESSLLVLIPHDEPNELSCLQTEFHAFYQESYALHSLINERGLTGELQIVLFHPMAVHSMYEMHDSAEENAKSFALRSPFPTFHFLREQDVLSAIKSGYPQPELIPERNAARLTKLNDKSSSAGEGGIQEIWHDSVYSARW